LNIFFITIDILTQLTLITLGVVLLLIPNPGMLVEHMFGAGNWPSAQNLIFGIAIAALCFTGVESVSQQGEETKRPEKKMPQTYMLMVVTVLILFAGISLVALTAMTPQELGDPVNGWARDPVAGIAHYVSQAIVPEEIVTGVESEEARIVFTWMVRAVRDLLPGLVAVLAATILLTATNAGMLGISRLTYNLSTHHQLPATLSRIHHRFRTPYVAIIVFTLVCLVLLLPGFSFPGFFADLGALYVFGSLLVFALAHAAILRLRFTKPEMVRPFRIWGNIRVKGRALPVTAILGLLSTIAVWMVVVVTQPYSRWA
jgi:APA family basic amino acid/polyamine antiporter